MRDTWFRMKKSQGEHYLWFAYFDDEGNDHGDEYVVDNVGYKALCKLFEVDRKDPESLLIKLRQNHGDRCDFTEFLQTENIAYVRTAVQSIVWKKPETDCVSVYNFVYGEDGEIVLLFSRTFEGTGVDRTFHSYIDDVNCSKLMATIGLPDDPMVLLDWLQNHFQGDNSLVYYLAKNEINYYDMEPEIRDVTEE